MKKRVLPKIKNYETFPKVNPTVDVACFNVNHTYMLFGKKSTDDKLRLIGGFADPNLDTCYDDSATREFLEETGGKLENVEYIHNVKINDKRFLESDDKVFTILFYGQLLDDKDLAPADDIAELKWVDFDTLCETNLYDLIIEIHVPLVEKALKHVTELGNKIYKTI